MTTYSIGIERDDGDFQLLATLNNNDGLMSNSSFDYLKETVIKALKSRIDELVICLERQDAPDYVNLEEA